MVVVFDIHDKRVGLSGSSSPTYWNVRFWFDLWCEFFMMMFRIRVNSDGVRGSRG